MPNTPISYQQYKKKHSAWTRHFRNFRDWLTLLIFNFLFQFLSISSAQTLGKMLGRFAYRVLKKEKGIVLQNLRFAYPHQTEKKLEQWTKDCFLHYGQFLFEFALLEQIKNNLQTYVTIKNGEILKNAYMQNQGVILLSLHLGNWEYLCPYLTSQNLPFYFITKNYANTGLNQLIRDKRERMGAKIVLRDHEDTRDQIYQCIAQKEILYILIDQDTRVASKYVPFFNIPAKTPLFAALLALKTGVPVVSTICTREENGTFCIEFFEVGHFASEVSREKPTQQEIFDVTYSFNQHLEQLIAKAPAQWAWFHRRWKSRPNSEELKMMKDHLSQQQ